MICAYHYIYACVDIMHSWVMTSFRHLIVSLICRDHVRFQQFYLLICIKLIKQPHITTTIISIIMWCLSAVSSSSYNHDVQELQIGLHLRVLSSSHQSVITGVPISNKRNSSCGCFQCRMRYQVSNQPTTCGSSLPYLTPPKVHTKR